MTYLKPILATIALGAAGAYLIVTPAIGQTASEGAPLTTAEKFAVIDADADGLVSEDEFVAYATDAHDASLEDAGAKFEQISGDDGVISLEEFEAVHTAHNEETAGKGS